MCKSMVWIDVCQGLGGLDGCICRVDELLGGDEVRLGVYTLGCECDGSGQYLEDVFCKFVIL